jgi:hypothetical protein
MKTYKIMNMYETKFHKKFLKFDGLFYVIFLLKDTSFLNYK